ncbi:hypothetical protein [Candidatus Mycolicibacterium alkanivorans]|uniref:Antitoxin VbhA domain-containing protein n=1 Tax=Candidatus Mycolicibacterium alkanivorans TaxID=2954114 RepID=A0ABS9YXY8_9MYCO|nr:hypothetical protein [Candidatus Mycolicibacterium alkanivorans]MCI4675953.1 hypothetical protein [Candidatus Mycolicibacterium alkanivorans]
MSDGSSDHEAFDPADPDADRKLVQELRRADEDYAAGNTVSGEELRKRFGLS